MRSISNSKSKWYLYHKKQWKKLSFWCKIAVTGAHRGDGVHKSRGGQKIGKPRLPFALRKAGR